MRNTLGMAIGIADVLLSAVAQAHQDIPMRYLSPYIGYWASYFGQGFVVCVI